MSSMQTPGDRPPPTDPRLWFAPPSVETPQQPRRPARPRGGPVLLVMTGIALLGFVGWWVNTHSSEPPAGRTPEAPVTHVVEYFVAGSAETADITYSTADGSTAQQSGVDVPITKKADGSPGIKLTGVHAGAFLYISAQNGGDAGTITCEIAVDGETVKHAESSGAYTIVTCSATAGR